MFQVSYTNIQTMNEEQELLLKVYSLNIATKQHPGKIKHVFCLHFHSPNRILKHEAFERIQKGKSYIVFIYNNMKNCHIFCFQM